MSKLILPGHPDFHMKPDGRVAIGGGLTDVHSFAMKSAITKTIASGAITIGIGEGHFRIDTESGAANDDLDTINGGESGEVAFFLPANDARTVRLRNGVGNFYTKHQTESRGYSFNSPSGSSGTFYTAGFYNWSATDAKLNDTTPTSVTHGGANAARAAHAGLVAGGAGSTDQGTVSIVVSGTSIDDEGNRSAADSETLVADITAMSTNQFFTTVKKWLGTTTWTITGAGGASTFNADFNYGFCKYEDFGNQAFTVTLLEYVGRAGANDTGFNVRMFHHHGTGWTYAASGFVPGGTVLFNMNTDFSTEQNLISGEDFSDKRTDLNTDIDGENLEGIVIEITTSSNKAVEQMDIHIGAHTAPKYAYLATTKQHLIAMKHGSNWLEL